MSPESAPVSCRELVELVTDWLEGALSQLEQAGLEAHLAECPGCEAYVSQMRDTLRVLRALGEQELSVASRDQLLAAFRAWQAT